MNQYKCSQSQSQSVSQANSKVNSARQTPRGVKAMPENRLISDYMGKRIDTPASPELSASQQIFDDLRSQSRMNKPEFKMPMIRKPVPKPFSKPAPVGPVRRVMPTRSANAGKQSVTNNRRATLLGANRPIAGKSSVRNNANLLKFDKPEDLF